MGDLQQIIAERYAIEEYTSGIIMCIQMLGMLSHCKDVSIMRLRLVRTVQQADLQRQPDRVIKGHESPEELYAILEMVESLEDALVYLVSMRCLFK